MKFLKGFLFVLSGLFIFITLFSLLIPSRVITVRGKDIIASKSQIYAAIKDFHEWKKWHPIFIGNPNAIIGNDDSAGIARSITWGVGSKNTLTISGYFPDGIKMDLTRPGENTVENTLRIILLDNPSAYQVEWRSVTHLKWYPWDKFAGIFINQITGPGYDAALSSLKLYVENEPKINPGN